MTRFRKVFIPFIIAAATLLLARQAAAAPLAVEHGDGGLVSASCDNSHAQVRIDAKDAPGMAWCFELVRVSGWVSLEATGSYGVTNTLSQPVRVAVKHPTGQVYWQVVVPPGGVAPVLVSGQTSVVVELASGPLGGPTGPSTSTFAEGRQVSLRNTATQKVLMSTWSGVSVGQVNRDSSFTTRVQATWLVTRARDVSGCFMLTKPEDPQISLRVEGAEVVAKVGDSQGGNGTWCVVSGETPSSIRLINQAHPTMALGVDKNGSPGLVGVQDGGSEWFVDDALAWVMA
ncbi:hypothetical protein GP475_01340 [Corynebacterium poyangense]|uniref:Uncharacterized protein n=1 Tax=Corynebacterium poyangense TaxID=2684405 RepID=A0A7H0SLJ6_9CORY|nr:hypothetical protein [Corynebacterium poyangense]MBZ8177518.1 hypothetical protein [Corynebacterium poyangense]QNQ89421.1 hypothetical protein GP475_01340 [Corynebacterium poyangense]